MYLSQLKLWNFRKFGDTGDEIDLSKPHLIVHFNNELNLLVGENDSGKSTIIDAIKLVLRTHSIEWIRVEDDDFYGSSKRFRIECRFDDLKNEEAKNFLEWLSVDNKSTSHKSDPYLKLILDVQRTQDKILPYDIKGGSSTEGKTLNAEAKEYLKATYLRPLRDAKAELTARKNSRLSQILAGHPKFKDKENHQLIKILKKANADIKSYFEDETNKENNGFDILKTLREYLSNFLKTGSGQDTKFHIDDPKLKNILEILKLTLFDERSGLGTYNLLFIAAELLHLKRGGYDGLKLGLIEELEAHLHPQAQLRIISALENESRKGNVQLILTTHSSNLASRVNIKNIILCHGKNAFSLDSSFTELNERDYNFLERFLDVTKANLFFAQGVILVEGDSENILIPILAKLIGKDLAAYGVSIVNVGGTAFLRYSRIFQRKKGAGELGLPVSVITDLDIKPDTERSEKTNTVQKKDAKYSGQSVKTFISPHWTFEYCLGLSQNLKELLFEAIKKAGEEMENDGYGGKKINDDWATFSSALNEVDLAKKIYQLLQPYPNGKGISKTITSQYLSKSLEEKQKEYSFIEALKQDCCISYIFDAINHAESNSY